MKIDRELVQKILDEELGGNYVIDSILDTEKYIFIDYKHKTYKNGDERGHLIGVGPVVLNKETGEYKLLGSGDYIVGDYMDYLPEAEETETLEDFFAKPVEEIIKGIHDREFVNDEDYFYFLYLIEKEFPGFNGYITLDRNLNLGEHYLFDQENPEHRQMIIGSWELIGFPYFIRNEKEIVMGRVKNYRL